MQEVFMAIFVSPFTDMGSDAPFLTQVLWEGFVQGTLYALIALGFVLIFKASGVFNFAQGIMVVLAVLTLVGLYELGVPAWLSVILAIGVMGLLAIGIERVVLRPLVNQHDAILLMATIGLARFLIGAGQFIFGGENRAMITEEIGLPVGSTDVEMFGGVVFLEHLDVAAVVIAAVMVAGLALFFNKTRIGRALRAVADDHQAALSVGISLNQIWAIVWFAAGIVALVTGIMWGARSDVSFALEIIALKALAVLIIGGFTSIPGAIIAGIIVGVAEKIFEIYWGPLLGGGVEAWFAYILALVFLLFRPQGLFGEKIIERI
jgi:branched-chain amino acid transport system permease protein